jgi:predicted RNA-binding protein YlxR (DUF448 family)
MAEEQERPHMMLAQPQEQKLETELDSGPRQAGSGPARLCAVTGVVKSTDELIRFVLGPDGVAVPDIKRRLPGRGVWITGTRDALATAVARKAFSRSFRREVRVPPDFVMQAEQLLERAALDALGIARKAGKVVAGFAKVEAALAADRVVAVLHAADAGLDGVRKLTPKGRAPGAEGAKNVLVIRALSSEQLDLALGRANVVHAALLPGPESGIFLARLRRLEQFRTGDPEGKRTLAGHTVLPEADAPEAGAPEA